MIEFHDVQYGFGDGDLLTHVTLSVAPGSFHFLTGPSGAGKTTLLRLCYLDLQARHGEITLFDQSTREMSRDDIARARRRIGVIHQDCQFLDHLSVEDNVTLPATVAGLPVSSADVEALLSWVGLTDRRGARPPELSGGERQRAAVARAVILSPEMIIADEPTGNVDWDMSQRLMSLLIELNGMGKTVLFATHDLGLIRTTKSQITARVLRIRDRQVQLAGAEL